MTQKRPLLLIACGAGILVGALVGGLSGRPESTSMTVAAGPDLFRHLDTFLTRLDPERDAPRGP